jgi:hypothetical protein
MLHCNVTSKSTYFKIQTNNLEFVRKYVCTCKLWIRGILQFDYIHLSWNFTKIEERSLLKSLIFLGWKVHPLIKSVISDTCLWFWKQDQWSFKFRETLYVYTTKTTKIVPHKN